MLRTRRRLQKAPNPEEERREDRARRGPGLGDREGQGHDARPQREAPHPHVLRGGGAGRGPLPRGKTLDVGHRETPGPQGVLGIQARRHLLPPGSPDPRIPQIRRDRPHARLSPESAARGPSDAPLPLREGGSTHRGRGRGRGLPGPVPDPRRCEKGRPRAAPAPLAPAASGPRPPARLFPGNRRGPRRPRRGDPRRGQGA